MNRTCGHTVVAAATLLVAMLASAAGAQTTDHLKCYKIKNVAAFKSANADFIPANFAYPGINCTLKGKAATLCVPAEKTIIVVENGTDNPFPAQVLQDAQLCYKVKCLGNVTGPLSVTDQLGTRTIERGKTAKVCGPAIEQ